MSTTNFAALVVQYRAGGWTVEWSRQQYKDPSNANAADGGYWYLIATCGY